MSPSAAEKVSDTAPASPQSLATFSRKETAQHRLGIVAAFRWEVRALLKQRTTRPLGSDLYSVSLKKDRAVFTVAGIGAENAYNAARNLIAHYPVSALVTVGCAAGLDGSLAPGDVVVGTEVLDAENGRRLVCQPDFVGTKAGCFGRVLCVSNVIDSALEKQHLGRRWSAIAADMESAGVARAAEEAGLPFAALKAISDSSSEGLGIDFQCCQSEHDGLSYWKLVRHSLTSVSRFLALVRLAGNSRRAAGSLALALGSL